MPVPRLEHVAWVAVVAVLVGTFSTWITAGPVTLNGIQGPNDGWLVVILSACAAGWARSLARGSGVGVAGVLGCAIVMLWTVYEDWRDARDVLGGDAGHGLLLVVAGAGVLAGAAVAAALRPLRDR